jgi:site-specific DNA-methyltransferase (adenine-specific)
VSETLAGGETWTGNEALRPTLVPLEQLRAHPRNPRRGAVDEIRKSLRRFGQQRPVLALPDGTIVAGHHVWRAAVAEGWSHLAIVRSDLSEREVEAYLVADNRLADLGLYDEAALAELLAEIDDSIDGLVGTGYARDELDELLAQLAGPQPPAEFPGVDPETEHRCPKCGYEWSGQAAPEAA